MSDHRAAGNEAKEPTRTLKERAADELKKFVALFIYLWVMFGLFVLQQSITLKEQGMHYAFYGFAAIKALIVAKIWLIADDLHFANELEDRPLIYSILYQAAALALLFLVCEVVEKVGVGLWKGHSFVESIPSFGGGGLSGVVILDVILGVSIVPFVAFVKIGRVMGERRLMDLLLQPRASLDSTNSEIGG